MTQPNSDKASACTSRVRTSKVHHQVPHAFDVYMSGVDTDTRAGQIHAFLRCCTHVEKWRMQGRFGWWSGKGCGNAAWLLTSKLTTRIDCLLILGSVQKHDCVSEYYEHHSDRFEALWSALQALLGQVSKSLTQMWTYAHLLMPQHLAHLPMHFMRVLCKSWALR